MTDSTTASQRKLTPPAEAASDEVKESAASWLEVVADKVKSLRYGVVQIVIDDFKVVQIKRTERTRFEVPQVSGKS